MRSAGIGATVSYRRDLKMTCTHKAHMTHVILLIEVLVCPQLSSLSCMCRAARRSAVLHFISTAKRSCSTSPTLWKHKNQKITKTKKLQKHMCITLSIPMYNWKAPYFFISTCIIHLHTSLQTLQYTPLVSIFISKPTLGHPNRHLYSKNKEQEAKTPHRTINEHMWHPQRLFFCYVFLE